MSDFDLEDLVNLEQKFYDAGFAEGFEHGKMEGHNEGLTYGLEKGYDMWEEIGFYEGFATLWKSIHSKGESPDSRIMNSSNTLLELIKRFPTENPGEDSDIDVMKILGQIRSRYKMLCHLVGVKPSLRSAQSDDSGIMLGTEEMTSSERNNQKNSVWVVQKPSEVEEPPDLSF